MGRYRLSHSAREDVTDIAAYIAIDNPEAALTVIDRIEQVFGILGNNPEAGRLRPEIGHDIRSFPSGPYVILYSQSHAEVLIIRVVHAARDLDELFGGNA